MYKRHIEKIVNRVNTVNEIKYKEDSTIFSWQLANEPQRPPFEWVDDSAKFIKSLDPHHMVSTGSDARMNGTIDFMNCHRSTFIDYATVHVWTQNSRVYDMINPSPKHLEDATQWAIYWLENNNNLALAVNKPLILEEFGLARNNWESSDIYSPNNPTTNRDTYYQALLQKVTSIHRSGGAFSGFGVWAYAGQARPEDRWIADPPHEPPGWYAVYDTDESTLEVLKKAYRSIVPLCRKVVQI
jgi:mannan endo-1,4-beta-mannosidase